MFCSLALRSKNHYNTSFVNISLSMQTERIGVLKIKIMPQMANNPSFLRSGGLSFTKENTERGKVVPAIKEFKRDYERELNVYYYLGEYISVIGGLKRTFLPFISSKILGDILHSSLPLPPQPFLQ